MDTWLLHHKGEVHRQQNRRRRVRGRPMVRDVETTQGQWTGERLGVMGQGKGLSRVPDHARMGGGETAMGDSGTEGLVRTGMR